MLSASYIPLELFEFQRVLEARLAMSVIDQVHAVIEIKPEHGISPSQYS